MKRVIASLFLIAAAACGNPATAAPIPAQFDSAGADRSAIEAMLSHYTEAVSTKNQALFESLLLTKTIPFSYIAPEAPANAPELGNYERFRHAVFDGAPFSQRFADVRIQQDGNLASVTLVFINTTPQRESWGWKTLLLLKTATGWKIASEFYTSH